MIRFDSMKELGQAGFERVCVACGVFDGIHRGHRTIIHSLVESAKRHDAHPVVFTFQPNPLEVLAPHAAPDRLMSLAHRLVLMRDLGVEAVVVQNFCTEFAAMAPKAFMARVLLGGAAEIRGITVGDRWRFGHRGCGDCTMLESLGNEFGFDVSPIAELNDAEGTVSSTRIRQLVSAGELSKAEELLGRPFSVYGEVRHGKGIATTELHYPTANVTPDSEVLPPCGIYAANAVLREDDVRTSLPGIMYLGYSPTFVETAPVRPFLEIHVFDFHEDVYGRFLEIEFLEFIRPDEKFLDSASLRAQIGLDVDVAKAIHATRRSF